jgi:hypothetical protein
MNRFKVLKNTNLPPVFDPKVILSLLPDVSIINSVLITFASEEWSQFYSRFRIVSNQKTAYDTLYPHNLFSAFSKIEDENLRVGYVFMNSINFPSMRSWDTVDIETHASVIRQYGILARVYGADVVVSRKVPPKLILISSEDGTVGVTLELAQETFKEAKELGALENEIQKLSQELNSKYRQMIDIIHNTIDKIENKDKY